jgi:ribokinase
VIAGTSPRVAVVGHVEWIDFAVVERLPVAGEIVTADDHFELAGGGGAVAAVQLRKLAGRALFLTALGFDRHARRAASELRRANRVELHAAIRPRPQRRAFTYLDAVAERTITVLGERLVPHGDDDLPWERLEGADAVFVSGGDAGAMREARRARLLAATPRAAEHLRGIRIDALVGSGKDRLEQLDPDALDPPPELIVTTSGEQGGTWEAGEQRHGEFKAAELQGPIVDPYGAGDTFAAGVTYALGCGYEVDDALAFGAKAGAANLTGRGPYGGQLSK